MPQSEQPRCGPLYLQLLHGKLARALKKRILHFSVVSDGNPVFDWFNVYVSYDKWTCRGMANWGQPAFLHAGKGDGCKTNGVAVAIFSKCVVLDSASLEVQGGEGESYPRASPHAEEEEFEDSTHARGTRAGTGGVRRPCLQTGGLLRKRRKFGIISGHGS